ncbi:MULTISPECIES: glutathione S-transferase N-terminal domain-containing protein [unclassified Beijerinckia]|uniref:glutathione S-transferase family protein n=1 Tax=unclassified Beijerinckia TaxID=2638183 RepID=UPI0008981C86|nr:MULTISPECIES: glutathione S-transferase N-terminal domain-containing protein [unclassified Beijerinckia]MDH7796967.1 glutathione S-transferase [Beijerinckia sp. GAS462]SEC66930.1 Glutathione S-transferase [Beijerinckia sp. 28-YEA-48]
MKLYWSPKSPFVRKVMILLHELGIVDQVALVRTVATPRGTPNPVILAENPLGKIPVLFVEGLPPLFDSAVIAEYLAGLVPEGARMLPAAGPARFAQLRWQALGDGLCDNLLLWRIERQGAAGGDGETMLSYRAKVIAALKVLEAEAPQLTASFGVGQIAILCALGQLDFRYTNCGWRAGHPALAQWEATASARPSLQAVPIVNDQEADAGPDMQLNFLQLNLLEN